jgi:hypothetical protein
MAHELSPDSATITPTIDSSARHATRAPTLRPRGKAGCPPQPVNSPFCSGSSPLQRPPFQTPPAQGRLSHENAGSSNTNALPHGRTNVQQPSPHIHSSVSDPAAPISLPPQLSCHIAESARNMSAHRLSPLPLPQSRQPCQPNAQQDGVERGARRRRTVPAGSRHGGFAPSSSDGSGNTTCPSRVRLTEQHNSHRIIG